MALSEGGEGREELTLQFVLWPSLRPHLVDDPKTGSGCELGPVGGLLQPLEVLAKEGVGSRPAVHEAIGHHHAVV